MTAPLPGAEIGRSHGYAFIQRKDGCATAVYVGTGTGSEREPTTNERLAMELVELLAESRASLQLIRENPVEAAVACMLRDIDRRKP